MSSSSGSGPDRRGSRRQRVAGSRGRSQSGAQQSDSQEPDSPESGAGQLDPHESESATTGATDSTFGFGADETRESGTGTAAADSDSDSFAEESSTQNAQLSADESDARDEAVSVDDSTDDTADETDGEGAVQRGRSRLRVAMLTAAAVLAGFGAWFAYETVTLHTSGAAANDALVDTGATSEVNGRVSEAVTKLFSYDFAEQEEADAAADELLVGPAVDKYNELWGVLREQAPEQELVVDTAVQSSAVTWLQGDRAEVLLYVDQKATRGGDEQGQKVPAQLTVGAEKHGDQWKINRITLR